jgi:hypothetical protein
MQNADDLRLGSPQDVSMPSPNRNPAPLLRLLVTPATSAEGGTLGQPHRNLYGNAVNPIHLGIELDNKETKEIKAAKIYNEQLWNIFSPTALNYPPEPILNHQESWQEQNHSGVSLLLETI